MGTTPKVPSSEVIRMAMTNLQSGLLSTDEYEAREEVLERAMGRLETILSEEVRALLAQFPPQAIEAYGLLLRWQAERGEYPQPLEESAVSEVSSQHGSTETDTSEEQKALNQSTISQTGNTLQINVQPSQDPINALYQAVAGPLATMRQLSQATQQPSVTFQAGPKMTLDKFQGAYKGLVTIKQGRGKKAPSTTETIAVIKDIYEAEQREKAQAVEDPMYWLSKQNMMSVYIVGERPEVGWLLGDFDPRPLLPAGTKPTPEQIVAYLHDPDDDEHWYYDVIKAHLRTPQQKTWLEQNDLTLQDILHGNTPIHLSPQLVSIFFQDWNAKLGEHVFGY